MSRDSQKENPGPASVLNKETLVIVILILPILSTEKTGLAKRTR